MNIDRIRLLASKFGIHLASECPIAKQHNIYGGLVAFQRNGETVAHCLWDGDTMVRFVPGGHQGQKGDFVSAIAIALAGSVNPPNELIATIRQAEAAL
jgi:hypothetical protein